MSCTVDDSFGRHMSSKIGRDNDGGVADQDQHEEAEEAEEGEEEDEGYEGDDSQAQQM